nr:hypothetical protein [uncultured bacterium]
MSGRRWPDATKTNEIFVGDAQGIINRQVKRFGILRLTQSIQ